MFYGQARLAYGKEQATTASATVLGAFSRLEDQTLSTKINKGQAPAAVAESDFLSLFPFRERYIQKFPGKDWYWQNSQLADYQLLGVISDEGRGILRGCGWGELTSHAVLDIDSGSKYHNGQELAKLRWKFAAVGLKLVPYQSSESGGWHLYLFFSDYVLSEEVERSIKSYLKANSYEIACGTLEVFPSKQGLRLPLQKGFGWLDRSGKLTKKREELTRDEALASFISNKEQSKRNWSEAKSRIESEVELRRQDQGRSVQVHEEAIATEAFEKLFTKGLDWEKFQKGREYWLNGLTDKSQRHDAVLCIGHYLWFGDSSVNVRSLAGYKNAKSRAEKIREWFKEKNNGFSSATKSGEVDECDQDIERACQWTRQDAPTREYVPYLLTDKLLKRLEWLYGKTGKLWTVEELQKANIDRSQDARQRIAIAVAQLEIEGSEIDQAKVAKRAGACRKTVRKHPDLLDRWGSELYSGGAGGILPSSSLALAFASVLSISILDSGFVDCPDLDGSGFQPEEEKVLPLTADRESSDQVGAGPLNSSVAPLFHAWQTSQSESTRYKAQALRVPTASLTPGPMLFDIQALRHVTAGGFVLEPDLDLAVMPMQLGLTNLIYLSANSVYVEPVSSIVTKGLPHSPTGRGYLTTVPLCKHEIYGSLNNLCGATRYLCSIGKQPRIRHSGNNSIRGP